MQPLSKPIDPATGIWPISHWGPECGRGIIPKDMGVHKAGTAGVRKISTGRKKINGKLWVPSKT
jgi:hypothetical protein